jgi:hypothetical protein
MRLSTMLHGFKCGCDCQVRDCDETGGRTCVASSVTYNGITTLWQACVCPKPEGVEFYRREYSLGKCPDCGVEKLL